MQKLQFCSVADGQKNLHTNGTKLQFRDMFKKREEEVVIKPWSLVEPLVLYLRAITEHASEAFSTS